MTGAAPPQSAAAEANALPARLRARRAEIEQNIFARVQAISDNSGALGPGHAESLRAAVGEALDLGIASLEAGPHRTPEIPVSLLAWTRLAARHGVGLDAVLRCCAAGFRLFSDQFLSEAEAQAADGMLAACGKRGLAAGWSWLATNCVIGAKDAYGD